MYIYLQKSPYEYQFKGDNMIMLGTLFATSRNEIIGILWTYMLQHVVNTGKDKNGSLKNKGFIIKQYITCIVEESS